MELRKHTFKLFAATYSALLLYTIYYLFASGGDGNGLPTILLFVIPLFYTMFRDFKLETEKYYTIATYASLVVSLIVIIIGGRISQISAGWLPLEFVFAPLALIVAGLTVLAQYIKQRKSK